MRSNYGDGVLTTISGDHFDYMIDLVTESFGDDGIAKMLGTIHLARFVTKDADIGIHFSASVQDGKVKSSYTVESKDDWRAPLGPFGSLAKAVEVAHDEVISKLFEVAEKHLAA